MMLNNTCEWCLADITFNENVNNSGLCDSCFKYTITSTTKHVEVKKTPFNHTTRKNGLAKFINGLKKALSVE